MTKFAAALVLGLMGLFGTAHAQNVNIRGDITAFDGKVITVKARDGREVRLELPENVPVTIARAFTMADVKPGMPLGVTTVQRDGQVIAIDVRPIPQTAPLGLSPYDLQPNSTMTNATLEGTAQSANGNELTLNYKTGTVKALVTPATAMSQTGPGTRADIKPGETIFAVVKGGAPGAPMTIIRMQVSKDGVKPTA